MKKTVLPQASTDKPALMVELHGRGMVLILISQISLCSSSPGRVSLPHNKHDLSILMATYVYETIPEKADEKPRRFEVQQKMTDPPLSHDPDSGLPVKRIITGGSGIVTHGTSILSMKSRGSK